MTPTADYVTALQPGDCFLWCDRPVTLLRCEPAGRGRYLVVTEDDGREHRLHYRDNERVRRVSPNDGPRP